MFSQRNGVSSCLLNIPYEDKLSSFTLDKKFLDPTTQCQLAFGLKPENTTIRPYLHQNVKYTFKKRNIKIDFQITKNFNLKEYERYQYFFTKYTHIIIFLQFNCRKMWCSFDNESRRSKRMPWADGTQCDYYKWCQRGKCV